MLSDAVLAGEAPTPSRWADPMPGDENWSSGFALPGLNGNVNALLVWNGDLYVVGSFTHADGVTVNGIARWDGSIWSALGTGLSGSVLDLVVYRDRLVTSSLSQHLGQISFWDGSAWTSTMAPFNRDGLANALAVYDDRLIVGGRFTGVDTIQARNIAQWDGSSWSTLGAGIGPECLSCSSVKDMMVYQGDLVVAGAFSEAGEGTASNIARWNGAAWAPLGTGLDNTAVVLFATDGTLLVGGYFKTAGGLSVPSMAKWNGSQWSTMGTGSF